MRLIDADALMERLKAWDTDDIVDRRLYNFTLSRVLEQPTIEPERKTGQWITNETSINCSKCKHCAWSRRSFEHVVRSFNFCPNCGADMRGEQG